MGYGKFKLMDKYYYIQLFLLIYKFYSMWVLVQYSCSSMNFWYMFEISTRQTDSDIHLVWYRFVTKIVILSYIYITI